MNKKLIRIIAAVILAVVLTTALVACVPSGADKAKAKLEKAGYSVTVDKNILKLASNVEESVSAIKKDSSLVTVTAYYFKDAKSAKEFYENSIILAPHRKDKKDDLVAKRSGKCVYFGHKDAVKAFA